MVSIIPVLPNSVIEHPKRDDIAECVLRESGWDYHASSCQHGFNGVGYKKISVISFRIMHPFGGTITRNDIIIGSIRIDPVFGLKRHGGSAIPWPSSRQADRSKFWSTGIPWFRIGKRITLNI